MSNLVQFNILDILKKDGEYKCQNILSTFTSPLNKDVENFLHYKAISFARQHLSITFLVFLKTKNFLLFVGYYTLANKFVSIPESMLSKTMQKRISKFSQYDDNLKQHLISMPLIAQLGKNFAYSKQDTNFSGTDLLTLACDRVCQAQRLIGGKTTYIECSSNPYLQTFYSNHDFCIFGQRSIVEKEAHNSTTLTQMIKYFKS